MSRSADSAALQHDDARWLAFVEPLRAFLRGRVPPGVDADDVAQDVFLRLARHRTTMADVRDLDAWVFRVARAALTDAWRAEGRRARRASELDPDALPYDADTGPEARAEISACVRPFVAALPAPYRRALELTAVDGLTQLEAARREGVSLSGMKSRVQRARATVVREIQQCCGLQRDARGAVLAVGPSAPGACPPPASFHQIERRRK
jgi:RNA polymerase sigma-70 factor (ECF subfamily)